MLPGLRFRRRHDSQPLIGQDPVRLLLGQTGRVPPGAPQQVAGQPAAGGNHPGSGRPSGGRHNPVPGMDELGDRRSGGRGGQHPPSSRADHRGGSREATVHSTSADTATDPTARPWTSSMNG